MEAELMVWDPRWAQPKQQAPPPVVQTEQMLKGIMQESQQWRVPPQSQMQQQAPGPGIRASSAGFYGPGGFGPTSSPMQGPGPYAPQAQQQVPPPPVWNPQMQRYEYPMQARPQMQRPQPQMQQRPPQSASVVPATKKKSMTIKVLWGLVVVTTAIFIASVVYFYFTYVK